MNAAKFLYGLDFGTSNSALSIYDTDKGELLTTLRLPSLLYFTDAQEGGQPLKYTVGEEAVSQYIEEGMKGRFMKSVKRILPRSSFSETKVFTKRMTASDLVTLIIAELKQQADTLIGEEVNRVVLGRPVHFDDDDPALDTLAQERLLRAAQQAGFTDIVLQYEPIAAAFAYERTLRQKERVLVGDLGGGTTDFTIIDLDPGRHNTTNRQQDILATGGIYIGGDNFDSEFMWKRGTPHFGFGVQYESMPGKFLDLPLSFFNNITTWEKMNFFNSLKVRNEISRLYPRTKYDARVKNLMSLIDHNLGYKLFQSIEQVKIQLSSEAATRFTFSDSGISINEPIALNDYNSIIARDVQRIETYLNGFLADHHIAPAQIDTVFLTGGTSLVNAIQDLFKRKFPTSNINSGDNFISVSKGLAYSGYLFSK